MNPSATPNPVNFGKPISFTWDDSTDGDLRANNKYEIELERSRNGGNYVKVGDSLYSNTNSISNYTGYISYAMPGDLFRFRVRAYDFLTSLLPGPYMGHLRYKSQVLTTQWENSGKVIMCMRL